MTDPHQLSFEIPLCAHEVVIERLAEEWRVDSARMVSEAYASINRRCGQFLRYNRIKFELEIFRFYATRGGRNG